MKRAYLLAVLLLFGVFPLNNSSGAAGNLEPLDFSFSTPTHLMLESVYSYTDDDAKEFRSSLDDDGDGTVSTDEVEDRERLFETNYVVSNLPNLFSLNDVFAEGEHVLGDINDAEGSVNSSKQVILSVVSTYTFDVSPDLDKYTFTTWYDVDETLKDGGEIAPIKVTVPEGYKITNVDGVETSDLSDSDRTITVQPIDNIVVVFEKDNSLPLVSLAVRLAVFTIALIGIGLFATYRRKKPDEEA